MLVKFLIRQGLEEYLRVTGIQAHNYYTLLGNICGLNYDCSTDQAYIGFSFNCELVHSARLSCMVSVVLKKTTQNGSTNRGIWC